MDRKPYTWTERQQLARAWETGGCQLLGLCLSRLRPHFGVSEYAAAVAAAREETGDDRDYSQDDAHTEVLQ